MLMVKAVWLLNVLWLSTMLLLTWGDPVHPGDRLSLPDNQPPCIHRHKINHVVANWAAQIKSPSFSRFSSSTTIARPALRSARAALIESN